MLNQAGIVGAAMYAYQHAVKWKSPPEAMNYSPLRAMRFGENTSIRGISNQLSLFSFETTRR